MGKPQIAVRIPPPLLAELNQYVERVGTSKTDVIVSAVSRSECLRQCCLLGLRRDCAVESEDGRVGEEGGGTGSSDERQVKRAVIR